MTESTRRSGLALAPPGGLLEQPALLLRPGDGGCRLLALSGQAVGFSRRREKRLWGGWPWPVVEVREQDEAPLVCTIRRRLSLWPRYDVCDAEGGLVGVLAGRQVLDCWLRPVMLLRRGEGAGEALDPRGGPLARWATGRGEVRLDFLAGVQHDPFDKMLVLAALLVR